MKSPNFGYDYTVTELFEAQCIQTPDHRAVEDRFGTLTYFALNKRANQCAYWLKKNNINSGEFVAILLEPSIDFIVSVLAVIKIGAVYIPLDALAPHRRLAEILEDALPKCVITHHDYAHHFNVNIHDVCFITQMYDEASAYSSENPVSQVLPTSPLYMMYTSGSTGRPKGVIIPHRAVVNLVCVEHFAGVSNGNIMAQFSNLAFDASTFELWGALLNGAVLEIVPLDVRQDHAKLKQFLITYGVEYLFLPSGFFHQLTRSAPDTLNSVRVIIFGGEQVNIVLLRKFMAYRQLNALAGVLIHAYGPTEATTYSSFQVLDEQRVLCDDEIASVGRPIQQVNLYILDEKNHPVMEGELYISGVNLAIGYHNSFQNQQKFMPNPFSQDDPFQRLYKTGDRVRQLSSGELLYLGRVDDQVKIGGFRIHLNEIERQLMRHADISLAAVKIELGGGAHQLLVAYIVLTSVHVTLHADDIRAFLSDALPLYMLPAKYRLVDELPLTDVGKIDKGKLDKIPHTDLSFHVDRSSSSVVEETIKGVWQHLLNRVVIDVNKNLFDLGANSLLITEACTQINEKLQSTLQMSMLVSHPTIYKLARYLEGGYLDEGKRDAISLIKKPKQDGLEIAIIGMSCRFPEANNVQEYWHNLCYKAGSSVRTLQDIEQFYAPFF